LRIRDKITFPFILLAFIGIAATALLSVNIVTGELQQRQEQQLVVASELLAQAQYLRNALILERVKAIIGADVLTLEGGEPVASTLAGADEQDWVAILRQEEESLEGTARDQPTVRRVELRGRFFTLVTRPQLHSPGALVVILKDTTEVAGAWRSVTMPIIVIGLVMAVLISLISHLLTRTITAPLQRLADASKKLAAGDWNAMLESASRDEVGDLATSLNEMAFELRRSEEKLLRSEKLSMTGFLAARVAHDIRNPLFSIKMRAQMICDRLPADSVERTSLEPVLKEIEQVEWVIQGLLDLASPAKLQREEANINDVIEDVLDSIREHLTHTGIEVEWTPDPQVPRIMLDPGRLKQVLWNLISNAAEAMPDGGVIVAQTGFEKDSSSVTVEIADVGEGIDEEHFEQVFDPFFTTKREGVGLGLVNARSLVEAHGGTLELSPRDGRGTRAMIRLPIQHKEESPAEGEM
jgi:signal transduction histidine kinase